MKDHQKYLSVLVEDLGRKIRTNLRKRDLEDSNVNKVHYLRKEVDRMSPETLGKIVFCAAQTDFISTDLDTFSGGESLLRTVAMFVLMNRLGVH